MWKVYIEYNLSCSQRLRYLVWWTNKQDRRITHVQARGQLRREASIYKYIKKDLVFFLILVCCSLRRGLISSSNSVAWFVPVRKQITFHTFWSWKKPFNPMEKNHLARSRQTEADVGKTETKSHNYKPDSGRTRLQLRRLSPRIQLCFARLDPDMGRDIVWKVGHRWVQNIVIVTCICASISCILLSSSSFSANILSLATCWANP